jgi:hypothetical protein
MFKEKITIITRAHKTGKTDFAKNGFVNPHYHNS